jgi:hypothetical protein
MKYFKTKLFTIRFVILLRNTKYLKTGKPNNNL